MTAILTVLKKKKAYSGRSDANFTFMRWKKERKGLIMNARALILQADSIARRQKLTQAQWSAKAGHAASGQTVSRMISNGDCKVSTLLALLDAIGCELEIKESGTM